MVPTEEERLELRAAIAYLTDHKNAMDMAIHDAITSAAEKFKSATGFMPMGLETKFHQIKSGSSNDPPVWECMIAETIVDMFPHPFKDAP